MVEERDAWRDAYEDKCREHEAMTSEALEFRQNVMTKFKDLGQALARTSESAVQAKEFMRIGESGFLGMVHDPFPAPSPIKAGSFTIGARVERSGQLTYESSVILETTLEDLKEAGSDLKGPAKSRW